MKRTRYRLEDAQAIAMKRRYRLDSDSLPHTSWPVDPEASKKRGRIEDYKLLMAEWVDSNPCASPEEKADAGRKIMEGLA